ncbi:MAG: hypothetical protein PF517_10420 [Salinivirgaceae bacterium]|jgi:Trp operon repressor|nr:hypothetical protein [Salinivirgaceae bacterium]
MQTGTFNTLNTKANIFEQLTFQKPIWWRLFVKDPDLYINIRKDNYINAYYYGCSIAKITFGREFKAIIHKEYLTYHLIEKLCPSITKQPYQSIALDKLGINDLRQIKNTIKDRFIEKIESEYSAEKWMQGKIIQENKEYIDSEFQFNKDKKNLRVDLIKIKDSKLTFVELKGITDNRLLSKDNLKNIPEIVEQMNRYSSFIKKYSTEIKNYYQKLLEVRHNIGIQEFNTANFELNMIPELLIVDTYKKETDKRKLRVDIIEQMLRNNNIQYELQKI